MPQLSQALRDEGFFEYKKKAGEGLCWVKGCQRNSRHDRCLCHMHEMRRWRALNKRTADYCMLRDHAKGRGIKFTISPDYWKGLTDAFGFYQVKEGMVLSVDRVDATKGYEEGNLRIVELDLNRAKGLRESFLPEHVQHVIERRRNKMQSENERHLAMDEEPPPPTWEDQDLIEEYDLDPDNCPF